MTRRKRKDYIPGDAFELPEQLDPQLVRALCYGFVLVVLAVVGFVRWLLG